MATSFFFLFLVSRIIPRVSDMQVKCSTADYIAWPQSYFLNMEIPNMLSDKNKLVKNLKLEVTPEQSQVWLLSITGCVPNPARNRT